MSRFCPGLPHCSPHTPLGVCTRFRAVRTRNERGLARAYNLRRGGVIAILHPTAEECELGSVGGRCSPIQAAASSYNSSSADVAFGSPLAARSSVTTGSGSCISDGHVDMPRRGGFSGVHRGIGARLDYLGGPDSQCRGGRGG